MAKAKSKVEREAEAREESGYQGRGPVRVKVYIFPGQLDAIEEIAEKRGIRKRQAFFECFALYIGTYLNEKADRRKK